MSVDGGTTFTPIAQLKSFEPSGSKQQHVDQTNLSTPANFTQPLAVKVTSGELSLEGVLIPTDSSQLSLGSVHTDMTVGTFLAVLSDGSQWMFQALVSEYVPFKVKVKSALTFSAKLTVLAGYFVMSGAFDQAAFDQNAFQVG
jgi:hypothetical protein